MKLIRLLILAFALACAAPAGASALTVDTLGDSGDGACTPGSCTLRDAIDDANDSSGPVLIDFSEPGVIEVEHGVLPELEGEITLDARPGPGWDGKPVIELVAAGNLADPEAGLTIDSNAVGRIAGFAIGGFDSGIDLENNSVGYVCANRIGTDPTGNEARPNLVGISIDPGSDLAEIGDECPEGRGNLISGNSRYGITVGGSQVTIDDNLIGTNAAGTAPLPNGPATQGQPGGGILVGPPAMAVTIGGASDLEPHNSIAFNSGPGIRIEVGVSDVGIRKNSIHSNAGPGIEFGPGPPPPQRPAPPALTEVDPVISGVTGIRGTIEGPPNTTHELEFFANESCDGDGEGRHFVASSAGEVETDAEGLADFDATLLGLTLPSRFFTATATAAGVTSAFSNCVEAPAAPLVEQPPALPQLPETPTPVNGESVTVEPKRGKVSIKLPGAGFVPLEKLESIPLGAIVEATGGRVRLTSANAAGAQQTSDFYGGRFRVLQQDGSALVTLRLRGGDFSHCRNRAGGSDATSSKRKGRRLWGSGRGRFRTEGNFGSASVRGTIWLTLDQCKGTFFKVRRGTVAVTDFVADKTFALEPGKGYWAKRGG